MLWSQILLMPAFMISIDFLLFMMSQWPQQMAGVSPSMISKFTLVRPSSSTCLPWGSSSHNAFDFCFFNRNPKCLSSLDLYDLFECTVSSRNTYWYVVLFDYVINSCFSFSNYLASQYTKKNIYNNLSYTLLSWKLLEMRKGCLKAFANSRLRLEISGFAAIWMAMTSNVDSGSTNSCDPEMFHDVFPMFFMFSFPTSQNLPLTLQFFSSIMIQYDPLLSTPWICPWACLLSRG